MTVMVVLSSTNWQETTDPSGLLGALSGSPLMSIPSVSSGMSCSLGAIRPTGPVEDWAGDGDEQGRPEAVPMDIAG